MNQIRIYRETGFGYNSTREVAAFQTDQQLAKAAMQSALDRHAITESGTYILCFGDEATGNMGVYRFRVEVSETRILD